MSKQYMLTLVLLFIPIWLACMFFGILMHLNRKPGTSFFQNPSFNPSILTERGRWARKRAFAVLCVGGGLLLCAGIIGAVFHL